VLLEALHSGVPVIATPVGGVTETIVAGDCGRVVPIGNAEALAHEVEQLALDRPLRARLAARARQHAPDFDIAVMVDRIEALYRAGSCGCSSGT